MSAPRIVALEGVDAVGKSTHADHLADALCAAGVRAKAWHHPKPPGTLNSYARALYFALARARLVLHLPIAADRPAVIVADRWLWSTEVAAHVGSNDDHLALLTVARAEIRGLPDASTILLHAPQEEIERRLRERGESIDGVAAQQAEYWRLAEHLGWPAVATTLPRERVTARLVQIVRGWL